MASCSWTERSSKGINYHFLLNFNIKHNCNGNIILQLLNKLAKKIKSTNHNKELNEKAIKITRAKKILKSKNCKHVDFNKLRLHNDKSEESNRSWCKEEWSKKLCFQCKSISSLGNAGNTKQHILIRTDEGQPRPKYIFNKCGTNIYFFTLQRFGPSPSPNFKY